MIREILRGWTPRRISRGCYIAYNTRSPGLYFIHTMVCECECEMMEMAVFLAELEEIGFDDFLWDSPEPWFDSADLRLEINCDEDWAKLIGEAARLE